jgi:proprotein convertase subtilisin/kexin type 5
MDGICKPCQSPCLECYTLTLCKTCVIGKMLDGFSCVDSCASCVTCPEGQFKSSGVCVNCPPNCQACTSTTSCQKCMTGFTSQNNVCTRVLTPSDCSSGFYLSNNTCVACPLGCASCTATSCDSCLLSYLLYNGACLATCPPATFVAQARCVPCALGCQACVDQNTCTACPIGMFLVQGACLSSCPSCLNCPNYQYYNPVTQSC